MKISILLSAILCSGIIFISCSKNNGDDEPPQSLSWRIDGGAEQVSDSTGLLSLFGIHMLRGKKGNTDVYVSSYSTNPGFYSMLSANASFGVYIAGVTYTAISGQLTIGSNTDRRLNGNFSSVLINGTIDTIDITGSFSNIRY